MIGQFFSRKGQKFNVIILAGGVGSRMGDSSEYIPKALIEIGGQRAIDWQISKFLPITKRLIVGIGHHGALLKSYLLGRNYNIPMFFGEEKSSELKNNVFSTMYCLDQADTHYPTLISFCDLLVLSSHEIIGDQLFLVSYETKGNLGTYRHFYDKRIKENSIPCEIQKSGNTNGILGIFSFSNTARLKAIVYDKYDIYKNDDLDLTFNIVKQYDNYHKLSIEIVTKIIEFGTQQDLQEARRLWETT